MKPCEHCPIPDKCLAKPAYCGWMARQPRNPVEERAVIDAARRANGESVYPSLATQAGNALAAAGRVVAAVATGKPVLVSDDVREQRGAICRGCEHHDAKQNRCTNCGCGGLKLELATEACPVGKW